MYTKSHIDWKSTCSSRCIYSLMFPSAKKKKEKRKKKIILLWAATISGRVGRGSLRNQSLNYFPLAITVIYSNRVSFVFQSSIRFLKNNLRPFSMWRGFGDPAMQCPPWALVFLCQVVSVIGTHWFGKVVRGIEWCIRRLLEEVSFEDLGGGWIRIWNEAKVRLVTTKKTCLHQEYGLEKNIYLLANRFFENYTTTTPVGN